MTEQLLLPATTVRLSAASGPIVLFKARDVAVALPLLAMGSLVGATQRLRAGPDRRGRVPLLSAQGKASCRVGRPSAAAQLLLPRAAGASRRLLIVQMPWVSRLGRRRGTGQTVW